MGQLSIWGVDKGKIDTIAEQLESWGKDVSNLNGFLKLWKKKSKKIKKNNFLFFFIFWRKPQFEKRKNLGVNKSDGVYYRVD